MLKSRKTVSNCGNPKKINTHIPLISKETDLIGRNLTHNFCYSVVFQIFFEKRRLLYLNFKICVSPTYLEFFAYPLALDSIICLKRLLVVSRYICLKRLLVVSRCIFAYLNHSGWFILPRIKRFAFCLILLRLFVVGFFDSTRFVCQFDLG